MSFDPRFWESKDAQETLSKNPKLAAQVRAERDAHEMSTEERKRSDPEYREKHRLANQAIKRMDQDRKSQKAHEEYAESTKRK